MRLAREGVYALLDPPRYLREGTQGSARELLFRLDHEHRLAVVVSAGEAGAVRKAKLTTMRAFNELGHVKGVVSAG